MYRERAGILGNEMNKDLTTLFTGRNLIKRDMVDSTNSQLAELLKKQPLSEGTALIASSQSAGRGQSGNSWISKPGKNILVSYVFYPTFLGVENLFYLNMAVSLAVKDYIANLAGESVTVKWPNDIYWKNHKAAGILIETSLQSGIVTQAIIGIGINMNQEIFPAEIPNAISLANILGFPFDLAMEFQSLCSFIEARYLQLQKMDLARIRDEYERSLFRRAQWHTYSDHGRIFNGKIYGVNERGMLILETEEKKILPFDLKQIRFVF